MTDATAPTPARRPPVAAALIVAGLALVLMGQAAADALAPPVGVASTGRLVGRTAFAYLTSLRTFVAASLWVRLDPIDHEYYEGRPLSEYAWLLPSMRMVVALDPQFVQAYYVAPWVLIERGQVEDGLALAKEGVKNNPRSGILQAAYAQMLILHADDIEEALKHADIAMNSEWASLDDKFDGYVMLPIVYDKAGMPTKANQIRKEARNLQKLLTEGHGAETEEEHEGHSH